MRIERRTVRTADPTLLLDAPGRVNVRAKVAFAPEIPKAVAYGQLIPSAGKRMAGDTIILHAPRNTQTVKGGKRLAEIVVNGRPVAQRYVEADGKVHDLSFEIDVKHSSWIALRHFPQLHTNPVNVLVQKQPIRASRNSALWCAETIKLLWKNRHNRISKPEREAAYKTYQKAIATYRKIAAEAIVE